MADGSVVPEPRKPDPARTREDILRVARDEFAEKGLAGARVDAIAARTRTTKRMIYYYFGSKEGLYLEVLERAYGDIRGHESKLDLSALPPREAMRRLIEATFDYQGANPSFIRLVANENMENGRFLKDSDSIRSLNVTVIDAMNAIIARGLADGSFTQPVDTVDLHMLISSVCFFRVANRHTFGTLFQIDLGAPEVQARQKEMLVAAVLGLLGTAAPEHQPSRTQAGNQGPVLSSCGHDKPA
jgi:AcrR family transcriptional regulator